MECNKAACLMILSKVVEDPQSGSCLNVSYADVSGPVANYNPTGSPYANHSGIQAGNFNSNVSLGSSISAGMCKHVRSLRDFLSWNKEHSIFCIVLLILFYTFHLIWKSCEDKSAYKTN